jgi:D-2-hydroxyacid dehydrogenase (NADP+)
MHVLVAVDMFQDRHLQRIAAAVEGGGTCERLAQTAPDVESATALSRADVVVGWPLPAWLVPSPVRFFQLLSSGYDTYVDHGLDAKKDFTLCNARGALSVSAAEHCIALMLALVRRLPWHIRDMATTQWTRRTYEEVSGTTACVVGLGAIGTEVARRCAALGMHVVGVRRQKEQGHPIASPVFSCDELRLAVRDADHLFVTAPENHSTVGLIGPAVFGAMKKGSYLFNMSRGSLVDEQELVARLRSGHLQGAGLDVSAEEPLPSSSPLWNMENVVITPHVAGRSSREPDRMCDLFLDNLGRFRRGEPLVNVVNPDCLRTPGFADEGALR